MKRNLRAFLTGMGSILDIFGVSAAPQFRPRPRAKSAEEALRGDMEKIGGDIRRALKKESGRPR